MGILGMGAIGSLYAKLIGSGQVPDMVLTAVTRMHPETAEALKEVLPEEIRIFQEAEDLLEYDNLDAVLVCMPHDLHEPLVLKVLEKGLAVFCDKPLGTYHRSLRADGKKSTGNRKSAGSDDEPAHVPQASVVKRCSAERPVRGAETGKLDHHGLVSDRQLLPVGRMADILEAGRRRRIV